jgi:hypothetical protein
MIEVTFYDIRISMLTLNSVLITTEVLLVEVLTLLDFVETHRVLILIVGSFLPSTSIYT